MPISPKSIKHAAGSDTEFNQFKAQVKMEDDSNYNHKSSQIFTFNHIPIGGQMQPSGGGGGTPYLQENVASGGNNVSSPQTSSSATMATSLSNENLKNQCNLLSKGKIVTIHLNNQHHHYHHHHHSTNKNNNNNINNNNNSSNNNNNQPEIINKHDNVSSSCTTLVSTITTTSTNTTTNSTKTKNIMTNTNNTCTTSNYNRINAKISTNNIININNNHRSHNTSSSIDEKSSSLLNTSASSTSSSVIYETIYVENNNNNNDIINSIGTKASNGIVVLTQASLTELLMNSINDSANVTTNNCNDHQLTLNNNDKKTVSQSILMSNSGSINTSVSTSTAAMPIMSTISGQKHIIFALNDNQHVSIIMQIVILSKISQSFISVNFWTIGIRRTTAHGNYAASATTKSKFTATKSKRSSVYNIK